MIHDSFYLLIIRQMNHEWQPIYFLEIIGRIIYISKNNNFLNLYNSFFSLLFIVSDGYQPFFLVNESLSIPNKNKWVADASIIYIITLIIIFIFRATFLFISNDTKEINHEQFSLIFNSGFARSPLNFLWNYDFIGLL